MSDTSTERERILREMEQAERKAWEALGKFRFAEFGHYASLWASLHRASGARLTNPFSGVAILARQRLNTERRLRGQKD